MTGGTTPGQTVPVAVVPTFQTRVGAAKLEPLPTAPQPQLYPSYSLENVVGLDIGRMLQSSTAQGKVDKARRVGPTCNKLAILPCQQWSSVITV